MMMFTDDITYRKVSGRFEYLVGLKRRLSIRDLNLTIPSHIRIIKQINVGPTRSLTEVVKRKTGTPVLYRIKKGKRIYSL